MAALLTELTQVVALIVASVDQKDGVLVGNCIGPAVARPGTASNDVGVACLRLAMYELKDSSLLLLTSH